MLKFITILLINKNNYLWTSAQNSDTSLEISDPDILWDGYFDVRRSFIVFWPFFFTLRPRPPGIPGICL